MTTLGGVCHIYNEQDLLPHFIKHHINLFDDFYVIDHHSTDFSWDIVETLAPNWKIVESSLPNFDAVKNDHEVMGYEKRLNTDWKFALNVTEFIWKPNFKSWLSQFNKKEYKALGLKSVYLVDDQEREMKTNPLWLDRHHGYIDIYDHRRYRYVHNQEHGNYHVGRHSTCLPANHFDDTFLLYFGFSPWPQCIDRKLSIQTRIPRSDIQHGLGWEHILNEQTLRLRREEKLKISYNLLDNPLYLDCYNWFYKNYIPV